MRFSLRWVASLALVVGGVGLAPAAQADDGPVMPEVIHVDLHPEPTVLAPGLRPTLTMSARLTERETGQPVAGREIVFKVFGTEPKHVFDLGGGLIVCTAVTDADGFATCAGRGLVGSVLSLLAGKSYAIHLWNGDAYGFSTATAPVIVL